MLFKSKVNIGTQSLPIRNSDKSKYLGQFIRCVISNILQGAFHNLCCLGRAKGGGRVAFITDRAVARSENPGGLVVLCGDNVSSLVEIGLTDLPKTGGL